MALVEKLLVRYNHEVNKLAEKHHKDFHNDIRIQKYITGWSTNMAMMIKGSGGNMRVAIEAGKYAEPLDPDKLQAALSLFRKTFGRSIMLEKFAAYDVNPDFLTNALKDEANEERKERGRKKIFQEYQRNLILDLVSQKDFLNGFFAAGIEDMDPTFEWRLELLEQVYQQNIDSCEDWREIFTVNFMKRFGHTDFFFLNPLNRFGSKSGKERVENLGFKETGLSEAEMRQIWINAMNKIDTETKYLESRRYKPVRINDWKPRFTWHWISWRVWSANSFFWHFSQLGLRRP